MCSAVPETQKAMVAAWTNSLGKAQLQHTGVAAVEQPQAVGVWLDCLRRVGATQAADTMSRASQRNPAKTQL